MKWPLYEELESFMYWLHADEVAVIMPYYGYFIYFGLLLVVPYRFVYSPLKFLKERKKKENFWNQYNTGGI